MSQTVLTGDALEVLRTLPDCSVDCIVCSPPYWGLRDYLNEGQIGHEKTPEEFVAALTAVFREARRVLADDGTCWVNIGDSYIANATGSALSGSTLQGGKSTQIEASRRPNKAAAGFKSKDLVGIPWMLAFALRADGWYLRQDIVWHKPNPMPESVRDRCTKAHEYIFLLSKSPRYYYDQDAIREPLALASVARLAQDVESQQGSERVPGKTNGTMKACAPASHKGSRFDQGKTSDHQLGRAQKGERTDKNARSGQRTKVDLNANWDAKEAAGETLGANKRSVWTIPTQPSREDHFAAFPEAIPKLCIMAGCKPGGTVLDPFLGTGTTLAVAKMLGRKGIGIELNPQYAQIASKRLEGITGSLFAEAA